MTAHANTDNAFATIAPAGDLAGPVAASTSGPTATWTHRFFESVDDGVTSGFWRCEPGTSDWSFMERGEIVHILSGSVTVTQRGGEAVRLGPGDVAAFPIGWVGSWEIHELLSKFYVIYT